MNDRTDVEFTVEALVQQTLRAHDRASWIVAEVEACLEARPDGEGRWAAVLIEKLSRLDVALRDHFRSEEQGALYGVLPERLPHLAERLGELQKEHGRILEMIRDTIDEANRQRDATPQEMPRLRALVQLVVATIERHEAAENELVVEAHWGEVGTDD